MVEDGVEELFEVVDHLVEDGPDWNALVDARVTLDTPTYPGLTLEGAGGP